jgi:hypothetical protein
MATNANSWKHLPFAGGTPIAYSAVFSADEFERIKMGLLPRAMEDKWFVYYEEPYLYFHRSWNGIPVYRVALRLSDDVVGTTEALCSKEVAASSSFDANYHAQLLDFLISNLLLGQNKPFPMPSGLNITQKAIFQHHISSTGYAEKPSEE